MISFKTWMKHYVNDNTPRGDLARDMFNKDAHFPATTSKMKIDEYFATKGICTETRQVFEDAWKDYKLAR